MVPTNLLAPQNDNANIYILTFYGVWRSVFFGLKIYYLFYYHYPQRDKLTSKFPVFPVPRQNWDVLDSVKFVPTHMHLICSSHRITTMELSKSAWCKTAKTSTPLLSASRHWYFMINIFNGFVINLSQLSTGLCLFSWNFDIFHWRANKLVIHATRITWFYNERPTWNEQVPFVKKLMKCARQQNFSKTSTPQVWSSVNYIFPGGRKVFSSVHITAVIINHPSYPQQHDKWYS